MNNEQEIIKLIATGDKEAFRQFYNIYADKVYNTALSYIQSTQEAEEITQDVFLSVYKSASSFKANSSVSTWIYRITVNTSLNYIKKRKRHTLQALTKTEYEIPVFDHPGIQLEQKENAKFLFAAVEKLPENQKTAFILSYIEGLARNDVADIMELSLKAVESLLQRGKKNLRAQLEKLYPYRRKTK